jgi:chloramphenicol 3-O phosphotransferase
MNAAPGRVIYLNGVAGAGKSTLASSLQAHWRVPLLSVGLDQLSSTIPSRFLGDGPDADLGARWLRDDDGRLEGIVAGPYGTRLLRGIPRMAAALARAGNDVLVDDVLLYPWRHADVARALSGVEAHLVEVWCPPEVARARLEARGNGASAVRAALFHDVVYDGGPVDLRLDAAMHDPDECLAALLAYLDAGAPPSALAMRRATAAANGAVATTR